MPRTARSLAAVAVVVIGILALVARASGGPATDAVTTTLQPAVNLDTSVPDVSTPPVPSVPTPTVPDAPVPTPSVPDVPVDVPSTDVPDAVPDVPSTDDVVPDVGSGSGSSSSGSGGGSTAAPGSGSSDRATGDEGGSSRGGSADAGVRASSAEERRVARAARERRLRRDVARYAGCLDALPGLEGEVLSLRAGRGDAEPSSRAATAEELGISTKRAAALERSGLKRLREAGQSGACSPAAEQRREAAVGAGGVPPLQPAVLLASHKRLASPVDLARGDDDRSSSGAGNGRSGGAGAGEEGASGDKRPGLLPAADTSARTAGYVIGIALVALMLAILFYAYRRGAASHGPRLADQTGTAAVWRSPESPTSPMGPAEPAPVAPEVDPAQSRVETAGLPTWTQPIRDAEVVENGATAEQAPAAPDTASTGAAAAGAAGAAAAFGAARTSTAGRSDEPVAPTVVPATGRRPRRPRARVAAASLVSLGLAVLRARRRR